MTLSLCASLYLSPPAVMTAQDRESHSQKEKKKVEKKSPELSGEHSRR